jgi:protein O-GlcNAc transferase
MKLFTGLQKFEEARQLQEAGRLAEAEAVYRQVLAQEPTNSEAMHLLGALMSRTNRHGEGIELIIRAINGRPTAAEYQRSLGRAFAAAGRLADAAKAFGNCLALDPHRLPAFAELGNTLREMGKLDEALAAYERGLSVKRDYVPCLNGKAAALRLKRDLDGAVAVYEQSLKTDPRQLQTQDELAGTLAEQGKFKQAVGWYDRALALEPRAKATHRSLLRTLMNDGDMDRAGAVARRAVELWPASADSHNDLGVLLLLQNEVDEAIEEFERAVKIDARFFLAFNNLGHAWQTRGELDQAIAAYDRALAIEPMAVNVATNRIYAMQSKMDVDPQRMRAELAAWDERFTKPLRQSMRAHGNDRSPERALKIGYVSPDFRQHVVAWNLLPMLEQRDREKFHVYCYSNTERVDEMTERMRRCVDEWRSIVGVGQDAAAEMIRADGIDILVDLALHTAGNRLLVMARKPAPVQVAYLGYAGTTGLPTIDYRLSDPYLDPPDTDLSVYSEETIRLPRTYWCYRPGGESPAVGAAPAIANGYVTFGCLANYGKVSPEAREVWGEIMAAMPASRLVVYCASEPQRRRLLERLGGHGVAAERVEFVGWQPWEEYMRTYNRIDVVLDPFPCGGGITTCDALFMGVPVISLVGKTAVGRSGSSVLSNLGLTELLARTPEEYRVLAARAVEWIALRPGLRERMRQSPLMDAAGFARDLEAIYRRIWKKWAATNA